MIDDKFHKPGMTSYRDIDVFPLIAYGVRTILTHVPQMSLYKNQKISPFFIHLHRIFIISMERALNLTLPLQISRFFDYPLGHGDSFFVRSP